MDWLSPIHQEQARLSKKIAEGLYQELLPQLQERPGVIASFVPSITPDKIANADEEALAALLQAELEHDAYVAFKCYTEWVAVRIIRSRRWTPRPLPLPGIIDAARFCESFEVAPFLLLYTIAHMDKRGKLPLLGQVKNGKLIPDRVTIAKWRDLFDWSETQTSTFLTT